MNENKMLNDKPIFVAKIRTFHGLILAATYLMFALVIYLVLQEQEIDKLGEVFGLVCGGFLGIAGLFVLYITLIFKKIMLFDDRIEVHCLNKVIVRTYSQIKSFKLVEYGSWPTTKSLILECLRYFIPTYLQKTFLHNDGLYKIKEILIKKGVKYKIF